MKNRTSHGWIQASPTQYLLHYRRGRLVAQGMGLGAWRLPVLDHCILVPCTAHNLVFSADQITKENQGIEIAGFAVWKIAWPELTAQRFDFDDPEEPTRAIGVCLKDVVESAIRHRVANMTIEEVLRKRASIIIELKKELDYITGEWGLAIDTIEIKHVRIMSGEVFSHLQSAYREEVRLAAAIKRMETEHLIATRRMEQEEEQAQQEAALRTKTQERESELSLRQARLHHAQGLENARLKEQLQRLRFAEEIGTLESQEALFVARERIRSLERAHELRQKEHEVASAELEAKADALAVDVENRRRADLKLIDEISAVADKLHIGVINLNPDMIKTLADMFRDGERTVA